MIEVRVDQGRGRRVVVTGGGNGIGAATAGRLASLGWQVVVADIDVAAAERVARECAGQALPVDVLDEASIQRLAELTDGGQGTYGLVNCAALFQPRMAPEDLPLAEWDRIVMASHRGAYVSGVAFGRRMAARGGGSIVNMASMVGHVPNHGHAYCSAKAAVHALTRSMAVEWGRSKVRVNSVSPGYVGVPRLLRNIEEGSRYAIDPRELAALGRLVEPIEVADTIAFLLCDQSSAITGTDILIDAGVVAANGWIVNGGPPPSRAR